MIVACYYKIKMEKIEINDGMEVVRVGQCTYSGSVSFEAILRMTIDK